MGRDLVVVCWDGKSKPLYAIEFDREPRFDLLIFDYSGKGVIPESYGRSAAVLSRRTEAKGQVFLQLVRFIASCSRPYRYIGILDDDIMIRISDIDHMLHVAEVSALDAFAPALSRDSVFTHKHTLRRENLVLHRVPWVEVMTPFYRVQLFMAAARMYVHSISSWGIDCFAMPLFQKVANMNNVAVIDAVMAMHFRPLGSGTKKYSNGRYAQQEMALVCRQCMKYVADKHPEWLGTDWYRDTFETAYRRITGSPLP